MAVFVVVVLVADAFPTQLVIGVSIAVNGDVVTWVTLAGFGGFRLLSLPTSMP
jgi:hypothetical protein